MRIWPYSEDGDGNYRFRFEVNLENYGLEARKLKFTLDWQEERFNELRDYILIKHELDPDWSLIPMSVCGSRTKGTVEVRPGQTSMSLHPRYSYSDYLEFIKGIKSVGELVTSEKVGISDEGREIWMLKIPFEGKRDDRKIVLVARIHPYETAGSYCMEGIVQHFLAQKPGSSNSDLAGTDIYLLPMINPDGVHNGLCKLTREGGADLSKVVDSDDQSSRTLKAVLDRIRPHVYCELHNWMIPDFDGIYFLNWYQAWRFIKNFPNQRAYGKNWKVTLRKRFFSIRHQGFKRYCKKRFNSVSLCLEFPWRNRGCSEMRDLGVHTIRALAKI